MKELQNRVIDLAAAQADLREAIVLIAYEKAYRHSDAANRMAADAVEVDQQTAREDFASGFVSWLIGAEPKETAGKKASYSRLLYLEQRFVTLLNTGTREQQQGEFIHLKNSIGQILEQHIANNMANRARNDDVMHIAGRAHEFLQHSAAYDNIGAGTWSASVWVPVGCSNKVNVIDARELDWATSGGRLPRLTAKRNRKDSGRRDPLISSGGLSAFFSEVFAATDGHAVRFTDLVALLSRSLALSTTDIGTIIQPDDPEKGDEDLPDVVDIKSRSPLDSLLAGELRDEARKFIKSLKPKDLTILEEMLIDEDSFNQRIVQKTQLTRATAYRRIKAIRQLVMEECPQDHMEDFIAALNDVMAEMAIRNSRD